MGAAPAFAFAFTVTDGAAEASPGGERGAVVRIAAAVLGTDRHNDALASRSAARARTSDIAYRPPGRCVRRPRDAHMRMVPGLTRMPMAASAPETAAESPRRSAAAARSARAWAMPWVTVPHARQRAVSAWGSARSGCPQWGQGPA